MQPVGGRLQRRVRARADRSAPRGARRGRGGGPAAATAPAGSGRSGGSATGRPSTSIPNEPRHRTSTPRRAVECRGPVPSRSASSRSGATSPAARARARARPARVLGVRRARPPRGVRPGARRPGLQHGGAEEHSHRRRARSSHAPAGPAPRRTSGQRRRRRRAGWPPSRPRSARTARRGTAQDSSRQASPVLDEQHRCLDPAGGAREPGLLLDLGGEDDLLQACRPGPRRCRPTISATTRARSATICSGDEVPATWASGARGRGRVAGQELDDALRPEGDGGSPIPPATDASPPAPSCAVPRGGRQSRPRAVRDYGVREPHTGRRALLPAAATEVRVVEQLLRIAEGGHGLRDRAAALQPPGPDQRQPRVVDPAVGRGQPAGPPRAPRRTAAAPAPPTRSRRPSRRRADASRAGPSASSSRALAA